MGENRTNEIWVLAQLFRNFYHDMARVKDVEQQTFACRNYNDARFVIGQLFQLVNDLVSCLSDLLTERNRRSFNHITMPHAPFGGPRSSLAVIMGWRDGHLSGVFEFIL